MEELLAAVVQLVLEVGFQVLVSGGMDAAAATGRRNGGCGWLVFHGLIGGGCGWASTLVFPHLMLPFAWLRVVNLVLAPFLAGGLTLLMDRRFNRGRDKEGAFWHGFTFALLFNLARFAFGGR